MFYKYHYEFTFRSSSNVETRRRKMNFLQLAVSAKLEENTRKWNFLFFFNYRGADFVKCRPEIEVGMIKKNFFISNGKVRNFLWSFAKKFHYFFTCDDIFTRSRTRKKIEFFILKITLANNFSKNFHPIFTFNIATFSRRFGIVLTFVSPQTPKFTDFFDDFSLSAANWLIGNWLLTKY